MLKNSFFKTIPFLLFIVLFNSCDKELNVIGEDLIGDGSFGITKDDFSVIAYNEKIGPIQSNNLPINPLGIYDNPSFGTTTANFVTQVALEKENPTIDAATATITSVLLTIPYFYDKSKTVLNSDGSSNYVLDSIYGEDKKAKMKLSIYESGYYMADLDGNSQNSKTQKFYSNQYSEFHAQLRPSETSPLLLNNEPIKSQNEEFFFDDAEHVIQPPTDDVTTTTRTPPGIRFHLNKTFFEDKILKAPAGSLVSNAVFKNYFRGLFFNMERIGAGKGSMAMLNFKGGKITISYAETVDGKKEPKTITLLLTGNTVSLVNQSNTNADYTNATTTNVNKMEGDANLYLKGGEGSMSILKIFGDDKFGPDGVTGIPNEVPDQLDIIRKNKYLINEANLVFYVNSTKMGSSHAPQRIYLYDFTNSKILADYTGVLGGTITGGGAYYKFRITNHIRNLVISTDPKNVELGLVVTEDISKTNFYFLRDETVSPFVVPMASVMSPLGTIVFGNNIPTDDLNYDKRLKFEIYYTKPN
ncbi:DUF4270 domain-containing protein [Flavobacterium taihuense]|uniref:DUF4270 domain-containing protein n=1 Tax=Flavobacterium taihuense TaxID=2857508 RepID=A0ABS6XZ27_9FLAO|nr:DUF4270 domain-containing protein [Flavobacterium taihuense]MBW4361129.1 DUF4270 domain-containing protein [Flavobacterium taihuense]